MPAAHQAEYTHTWVIGAQRALQLADWSGKPSLTCIQSVVLLPIVLMHAGGIKRLASWIAAALRMAQLLDLHKLDDGNGNNAQNANSGGHGSGGGGKGNANGTHGNGTRRVGAASTLTSVEKEIGKRKLSVHTEFCQVASGLTRHPFQQACTSRLHTAKSILLQDGLVLGLVPMHTVSHVDRLKLIA